MTGNGGISGIGGIGGWRRLVGGVKAVIPFDGFLCVYACVVVSISRSLPSCININQ